MPIRVACPSCSVSMTAPDTAAGKVVHCPKCKSPMVMPAAAEDFKVVDEPPPVVKARLVEHRRDDDIDDRPRRRPRDDDDDYEDSPRRRRREEDARPRRKSSTMLPLLIGGGVTALVLVLVGGLWAAGVFTGKPGAGRTPPAGWALAAGEHFSCFLRDRAQRVDFNNGSLTRKTSHGGNGRYESWTNSYMTVQSQVYDDYTPGSDEQGMLKELKALHLPTLDAPWMKITSKSLTTFNGMPCLEVRWQHNDNWQDEAHKRFLDGLDPESRRFHEDSRRGRPPSKGSNNPERNVARVIVSGKTVFVLTLQSQAAPIDEADLKTFFDSFQAS